MTKRLGGGRPRSPSSEGGARVPGPCGASLPRPGGGIAPAPTKEGTSKVVNDMEQYLGKALKQAMLYTPKKAEDFEELDSDEEEEANNQELPATIVIDKYELEMGKSIQKW